MFPYDPFSKYSSRYVNTYQDVLRTANIQPIIVVYIAFQCGSSMVHGNRNCIALQSQDVKKLVICIKGAGDTACILIKSKHIAYVTQDHVRFVSYD